MSYLKQDAYLNFPMKVEEKKLMSTRAGGILAQSGYKYYTHTP